jgi:repressor LexA
MTLPISKPQQQLLEAWRTFSATEGRTPSIRELCRTLGRAPSTVHQLLKALEKKGLMQTDGTAHGWRTKSATAAVTRIPIRGVIAAGAPIEALESTDDCLELPAVEGNEATFALRVRGNSMIDDHILDGDVVLVKKQSDVADGEIAVALLDDGSATLKRVYREPDKQRVRLQPANASVAPIYASRVAVQGKVVGVVRTFHG